MPSKTETQRVLSGTLNLLPPGDQIPDGDALQLLNWRVDQQGQLRTRKGSVPATGPIAVTGVMHSLARSGDDRYAGAGTAVLWSSAAAGGDATVASGLDGQAFEMVFFQGAGWLMNQGQQKRFLSNHGSPPTATDWGIAAPAAAPGLVANAQVSSTMNPYNAPTDVTFAGYWVGSTFNNLLSGSLAGSSVNFGATGMLAPYNLNPPLVCVSAVAQPWELVTEYAPTFDSTTFATLAGPYTQPIPGDTDLFQFPFYCSDPTAIDSIEIKLYSNQASLGDSAPTVSVTLDRSYLSGGGPSVLSIRRAIDINLLDLPNSQVASSVNGNPVTETIVDPTAQANLTASLQAPHFMEYVGAAGPGGGQAGAPQYTGFNFSLINGAGPFNQTADAFGDGTLGLAGGVQISGNASGVVFDWTNISGIVITVRLNAPCVFGLGAATILGSVVGNLTGSGTFFFTYFNAQGNESNPSPGANISLKNQGVQVANLWDSADPQVTGKNVYMVGFGIDQPLLIGSVPNGSSTLDYAGNIIQAQAANVVMQTNYTYPPPAALGCMGPYFGRIIAYNTAAHPARYFWTPPAQPWFFPGNDEADEGNWEDAGQDSDPILAMTNHKLLAMMYKQKSIWMLLGDPDSNDAMQCNENLGIVGPKAVANAGQLDFFGSDEGIYQHNLQSEEKVSGVLDPLFKGDPVLLSSTIDGTGSPVYAQPVEPTAKSKWALEVVNDRLYFSYATVGNSVNNACLVMHIPTRRWAAFSFYPGTGTITALSNEGTGAGLVAGVTLNGGANGSEVHKLEQLQPTDNGNPIPVLWQSRFSDQGLPDNYKWYADLEITFQTAGPNEAGASMLTVSLCYDNGTQVTLGTISSASRTTVGFGQQMPDTNPTNGEKGLRAKNVSVVISGNVTNTCIIYGVYLRWYPEERVGLVYDSGFTNLGAPERVKQADYVEMYASGTQPGQAITSGIYSDLPGSALTLRETLSLTLPVGRGDVRTRLASLAEGRNFRWRTSSANGWQAHSVRVRSRVIGEYIDGTLATPEYYESPEFSVQPGRVGELKDFLLDYDTLNLSTGQSYTGSGTLVIYSDLPGNALSIVRTIPIPPRATRSPFVFALEDASDVLPYGQLFKIRIYPPAGGVMRLHGRAVFRARLIGTFFDGSQGEIWETQPLDLIGSTGLFREVRFVAQAGGPMTLYVETSIPGMNVTTKSSFGFTTQNFTAQRQPIRFRLPGNTRCSLSKFRVDGPYWCRLFKAEVYCRDTGSGAGEWRWAEIPLPPTPDDFAEIQMPVRETPESFTWNEIPVDPIE